VEDLEQGGILPPSPFRGGAVGLTQREASDALLLSSQDFRQPVSACLTRDGGDCNLQRDSEVLPGTFDSLDLVQDTGATPSPRVYTPVGETFQSSLGRRLKTSIGVKVRGSGYGEESQDSPLNALNLQKDKGTSNVIGLDSNLENTAPYATNVPNVDGEDDDKSVESESYTTAASSLTSNVCKICHCGEEDGEPKLITPCLCSGSLKFVHQECLHRWIKSSDIKRCELCKFTFIMQSKVKPLAEWEKLDMSSLERRKLCCSVTFHFVAVTCVVWSLYVLIDRTTEEIQSGELQWPFWTKLVVVAIGFTGGLVFMYIQCKVYIQICKKWKAYNRTIVVQDLPPDMIEKQKKAIMEARKPGKEEKIIPASSSDTDSSGSEVSLDHPETRSSSGQSGEGESRSNAETQTALRGISLESALRNNRVDSSSSETSDVSVATISRLLEQMDGGPASGGGMVAVPTVIFFTDSEVDRSKRQQNSGHPKNRSTLAEPLLICDLPGQNISLGTQLRDNTQSEENQGLDSLGGRVDGPDLSFDIDTFPDLRRANSPRPT